MPSERQKRAARQARNATLIQEQNRLGGVKMAEYDIRSGNLFDGSLQTRLYAAGSVGPTAIGNAAVLNQHIGAGAVGPVSIANAAVGNVHIAAGSVGPVSIANQAIGNQHYAPNSIGPVALANAAVGNAQLATGAVGPASIANAAVAAQHYAAGSIGPSPIAAGAITSAAIGAGAVGQSEIATGGVTTRHYVTGSIGPDAIASGGVGRAEIASGAVGFAQIGAEVGNPIRAYMGLRSISGTGQNQDCASSDHTHSSTPFVAYGRAERLRVLSERTRLRTWQGRVREAVEDPDSLAEVLELLIANNLNALKLQLDYAEVSREEIEEWLDAGGEQAEDYRERNMMDGHSRRHPLPQQVQSHGHSHREE